ncbi:hypothetical protein FHS59_003172 [Algoriphagus iocasae]|jgi:hypothetical protein|uniref:Uncharacterized protein n=1 Tax=Algoriphagus iocasae TaxID=1836499 RepID=A0A841MPL7_9BACT|nr:hypothetical protein [Algoriphagus iocasae]
MSNHTYKHCCKPFVGQWFFVRSITTLGFLEKIQLNLSSTCIEKLLFVNGRIMTKSDDVSIGTFY